MNVTAQRPEVADSAAATVIGILLSVAATGFLLIPLANRAFGWWLLPTPPDSPHREIAGIALIVGGYALAIGAFSLST